VDLVTQHYCELEWNVKDVGAKKSYDLHCEREGKVLYVEVKGTTSTGDRILLTRNEVLLHKKEYPMNALAIVSEISLDRSGDAPSARGGALEIISPWDIDETRLETIAYVYRRPPRPSAS